MRSEDSEKRTLAHRLPMYPSLKICKIIYASAAHCSTVLKFDMLRGALYDDDDDDDDDDCRLV